MTKNDVVGADTGAPTGRQYIVKALVAALWAYGGRGTGLVWTVLLTSQVGIGSRYLAMRPLSTNRRRKAARSNNGPSRMQTPPAT